jgi:hypothetical protein
VIIRPGVAADRPAVIELALNFHRSTPYAALLRVERERIASLFDMALAEGVVLIAEGITILRKPIGFLALVALEHSLSGERYAEEVAWWVEPEYRSGTLGPRLLGARRDVGARSRLHVYQDGVAGRQRRRRLLPTPRLRRDRNRVHEKAGGVMALFGAATSSRDPNGKKRISAPPPVAPASLLAASPAGLPPDAAQQQSAATVEAVAAAKRTRKKAAAGSLLTNPALAAAPPAAAVLRPKSLVGY